MDGSDVMRFSSPVHDHATSGGAPAVLTDEPVRHIVAPALDAEDVHGRDER